MCVWRKSNGEPIRIGHSSRARAPTGGRDEPATCTLRCCHSPPVGIEGQLRVIVAGAQSTRGRPSPDPERSRQADSRTLEKYGWRLHDAATSPAFRSR